MRYACASLSWDWGWDGESTLLLYNAPSTAEEELEELREEFQKRLGASDRTIAALQEEKARLTAALAAASAAGSQSNTQLADLQSTVDILK
jgi:chromosome segregation ATPase